MYTMRITQKRQYGMEVFRATIHLNGDYIGSVQAFSPNGVRTQAKAYVNRFKTKGY